MTQLQLYLKVKSQAWRRYLSKNLGNLESEINGYLLENNSSMIVIVGDGVKLAGVNIMLEKLPFIDLHQLKLYFPKKQEKPS